MRQLTLAPAPASETPARASSPPSSPGELLERVRVRVADRARWTQRVCARDAGGKPVPPDWREAVSWSIAGALAVEGADASPDVRRLAWAALCNAVPKKRPGWRGASFTHYEDRASHRRALELLDRARSSLTGEAGEPPKPLDNSDNFAPGKPGQ